MKPLLVCLFLCLALHIGAQEATMQQNHGPRVGLSWVFGEENGISTLFGYHVDTWIKSASSIGPVIQFDALAGGMEQGEFFPTATLAIGARHVTGFEGGVGPQLSFLGTGVTIAIGYSFSDGGVSYPVNLALGFSDDAMWLSLLSGFNFAK